MRFPDAEARLDRPGDAPGAFDVADERRLRARQGALEKNRNAHRVAARRLIRRKPLTLPEHVSCISDFRGYEAARRPQPRAE
jgi:hypothetical protein